jgi:methionyl-tRNA formyltransferase
VETAHNFVRGLSPYPGAWTTLLSPDGKETVMKIYRTTKEACTEETAQDCPTLLPSTNGDKTLRIALRGGILHIHELQLAGKKRMNASDFLRGTSTEGYKLK